MISFWWAIATFFIGGTIGFFLAAICNMASKEIRFEDGFEDDDEWRID